MTWLIALGTATLVCLITLPMHLAPPARVPVAVTDAHVEPLRRPRTSARIRRAAPIAVAGAVALVVASVLAGIVVVAIEFARRRFVPIAAARRRRREIARDLPDALDLFVLVVHAGLTPRDAVAHLAAHAPPSVRTGFGQVIDRLRRGDPLADALRVLPTELGLVAHAFVDVVGTADRYGLPLAPVLDQLARESRAGRRRLDEAAARSLPVRLAFPLVVCTLPSFVLLAIIPAVLAALSSLGDTTW